MSQTANFASTPWSKIIDISAANTNRDGTGTIVGASIGATGGRVDRIEIKAIGTTTSGVIRAYKRAAAGVWKLWREYAVSNITPSALVATFAVRDDDIGEILEPNMEVGFSTHNAEAFAAHVSGGVF